VDSATKALALDLREKGKGSELLADMIHAPLEYEAVLEAVFGNNLQRLQSTQLEESLSEIDFLKNNEKLKNTSGHFRLWLPQVSSTQKNSTQEILSQTLMASSASENAPSEKTSFFGGLTEILSSSKESPAAATQSLLDYLLSESEVIGPLEKILFEDEANKPSWSSLIENVWVVKSFHFFSKLLKKLPSLPAQVVFVSMDGGVLHPNGFIDISHRAENEDVSVHSLVHRKSEIKELSLKQSQLEEELGSLESFLKVSEKNIEDTKLQIRELTARLVALNPDLEKHSDFLRQVDSQIARLAQKQELLKIDSVKTEEDHSSNNQALNECSDKLSELEKEKLQLDDQLSQSESDLKIALHTLSQLESDFKNNEKHLQELQREIQERRQNLAGFKQESRMIQTREEQMRIEEENIIVEVGKMDGILNTRIEELQNAEAQFQIWMEEESQAQHSLLKIRQQVEQSQKSVEQTQEQWQQVLVEVKDLEQDNAIHDLELKNIQDKIKERYQVEFEGMDESALKELLTPGDLQEILDVTVTRDKIENLRSKIDRLGKINMVAKEEFDEKRQRFEYLFIQKKDVEDAIQQLKEAINRFDSESRERFEQSFQEVNQAFQSTFPVLFGGGNAELRLTDPSNLLESGVEIVAQPPGKKLQSVSLLSGGEKALTAVSLIFGIFSIKPSPFCVLDEVDAPLDDTNVGRFNTQVRNMSNSSQIIMITHHKKTMESSDAMYGVTMENPGVSKIASARLGNL
jgi:chromosome segregation protein